MSEIIIGRNGNQPFPITAQGVSSHHASLTIKEDGVWVLRDLNSKNGTYVRNNRFQFERIGEKVITKDSFIRLGDETINGITFMALQLIKEDPDDYTYEYSELRRQWEGLKQENKTLERRTFIISFLPVLISFLCMLLTFIPLFKSNQITQDDKMRIMRLLMIIPSFFSPLINYFGRKRIKQLGEKIQNIMRCPNPNCGHMLTEQEIIKRQCLFCRSHG